jgi:hypothetical protein
MVASRRPDVKFSWTDLTPWVRQWILANRIGNSALLQPGSVTPECVPDRKPGLTEVG